jgi:hypothetical protein
VAIGSEPEIGAQFGKLKLDGNMIDHDYLVAFYKEWKVIVGKDLQGGWASLHYAKRDSDKP